MESENENKEEQVEETAQNQETEQNSQDSQDSQESKEESSEDDAQAKIEALQKEVDSWKDQFLRKSADFDNYRKRMIAEKADAIAYANASLLKDLLESLDNFDRTVQAAQSASDAKSIADGVAMINKSLVSMLENKYNLVGYGAAGDAFDPDIHEAIGMKEGDVKEEQLAEVYLKGYKLNDRVIRHAKVMVVKPKSE